ncbi:hypothetical protein FHS84_003432 [Rhizomicrobium electricum]|nr:hypothetical protein [Rhizomicrobium electricum]
MLKTQKLSSPAEQSERSEECEGKGTQVHKPRRSSQTSKNAGHPLYHPVDFNTWVPFAAARLRPGMTLC